MINLRLGWYNEAIMMAKGSWHITSCYKAIMGRCIRTSEPGFVNFNTRSGFEEKMIREFGSDRQDVYTVSEDSRSCYECPTLGGM